ncbi:MAG: VOC family protein [Micromonosporaceae bacterium]
MTATSPTHTPSLNGVPAGYTTLTPYLVIDGAAAAIDFYRDVFGATTVQRMDGPGGTVSHAELDFGTGRLQLSDPMPSLGLVAPDGTHAVNHSTVLYCDDVDATYQRAVAAGAHSFEEPATFVTGDRFASILDPYGHRWAILSRVEDVVPEEAERRLAEWAASAEAPEELKTQ